MCAPCGLRCVQETYEELIATVEVAQLWDTKAAKGLPSGGFQQVGCRCREYVCWGVRGVECERTMGTVFIWSYHLSNNDTGSMPSW
jgi:hypothetical protein